MTALAHGVAVFGPSIAHRIIEYFAAQTRGTTAGVFPELTDREREILDLVAQGMNNTAIARRLSSAPNHP